MATKEGLTWKNPIRMQVTGTRQAAVGATIFNNQVPGLFVSDFGGFAGGAVTYVCTAFVTEKNEPVWAKIDADNISGKPSVLADYSVLVNYDDKDTARTISTSDKLINYEKDKLSKRKKYNTLGNVKIFGTYVFLGLSTKDVQRFSTKSDYMRKYIEDRYLDSELLLKMATVPTALKELYDFMSKDSNGNTGPGFRQFEEQTDTNAAPKPASAATTSNNGSKNPSASSSGKSSSSTSTAPAMPASKPVTIKILDAKIMNNGNDFGSYNMNERRPYMEQKYFVYADESGKATKQEITRRHVFDVVPNSFEFSQLSSTWNEVERSGNYPLVDWAKYNLTKVSFRFLVHGTRTDVRDSSSGTISTVVNDGLEISIDEQLDNLRSIGGAAKTIRIYNMNTLLTDSYRYPYLSKAGAIQWVIGDMSVTATRLTPNGSRIATAEVSMTLTEYPVIGRDIVALPPLSPSKPIIPGTKKTPPPPVVGLQSSTLTWPPDEPLQYSSSKAETDQ